MAHFAKLDENNVVVAVYAGRDEDDGRELDLSLRTGDVYKQTSYNTIGGIHILGGAPFRKNFAGIGYVYDSERDAFIPPKLFNSWTLNEESCMWEAPVPKPEDGKFYSWDEESLSWTEMTEPTD